MKTPLSKIWLRCTLCALLIGTQACDNSPYVTEILLRANFNEDTLGDVPDVTLPGDPVGDELYHSVLPSPSVVNSPFSGGAPYAIHQSFSPGNDLNVEYLARPSSFSGIVRFGWNGRLINWTGEDQGLIITIDDGFDNILAYLAIRGQALYEVKEFGPANLLGYPFPPAGLGNAATDHVFIIEVNYAKKTYDVILAGQNLTQNVFKYTNIPLYELDVVLPANTRPRLGIRGVVNYGGSPAECITDNVTISRKFISIPDVDL